MKKGSRRCENKNKMLLGTWYIINVKYAAINLETNISAPFYFNKTMTTTFGFLLTVAILANVLACKYTWDFAWVFEFYIQSLPFITDPTPSVCH